MATGLPGALLVIGTAAMLVALTFGADPLWTVEPLTLPEAAALHDNGEIVRLIELGADPNSADTVRADVVHHDAQVLTPLEAAVGAEREDIVQLLLELGAVLDPPTWIRLACFADAVGAPDVRSLLDERRPAGAPSSCDGVEIPWS